MTEQTYATGDPRSDLAASGLPPLSPSTSLPGAIRRYPMVVLFALVLLAAAGVTYGLKRSPIYTASVEMNVGVPNSDSQATPGYTLAAQQLAASYSREATSQVVTDTAGRSLGLDADATAARLSSSAVPDSPTFYVNATGPSSAAAIELVDHASGVLRSKVNTGVQSVSAAKLLTRYEGLQAKANLLEQTSGSLQGQYKAQTSGLEPATTTTTNPTSGVVTTRVVRKVTQAQVNAAKLRAQSAQLQAQTAAQRYTSASANGPTSNIVVLAPARAATSDRTTITERYGIVGAIAGLVIGVALAFLLARWRDRRAVLRF